MSVAVCTYFSGSYRELGEVTLPNKQAYCDRHGYELLHVYDEQTRLRGWDRVRMVAEALPRYDVVMWLDADTVITRPDYRIEDIAGEHLTVAADLHGLNTGVFIARNTPKTRQFFHAVLGCGPLLVGDHPWQEQKAMSELLVLPPYRDDFVTWAPQELLNAYLVDLYRWGDFQGRWTSGSWILHLPGLDYALRVRYAREYVAMADAA